MNGLTLMPITFFPDAETLKVTVPDGMWPEYLAPLTGLAAKAMAATAPTARTARPTTPRSGIFLWLLSSDTPSGYGG